MYTLNVRLMGRVRMARISATKWEYNVRTIRHGAIIEDVLNDYGDNGWELVTATMQGDEVVCYFKRTRRV